MKNFVIITQFFPPDFAATGQFIEEIVLFLSRLNYRIHVFTSMPNYAYSKRDCQKIEKVSELVEITRSNSVNFVTDRIRWKALNGILFCIRAIIEIICNKKIRDTIIITSAPPFLIFVGPLYKLFFKKSYICIVYDIYPEVIVRLGVLKNESWIVNIWKKCNKVAFKGAERIVVLTQEMKNIISDENPECEKKIWIIPTWADGDKIVPIGKSDNYFVKTHSLQEYFTLMYSGNLGRCHDAESILELVKLLKDIKEVKFVLIGGGIGQKLFREEIIKSHLDNILLLPYQKKEEIPFSLTACDVSVLSIKEGFEDIIAPSKLYGMLAAGRPIIAFCSPNSYISKLISNFDCGRSFSRNEIGESFDYIKFLASSPNELERIGKNARKCFEANYTIAHSMQKFIEMLNSLN